MSFVTRHLRPLGLALGLSLAALHAVAAQEDKVVATINGQNITESDLTRAAAELDPQFAQLPEEQRRTAALSALIELRLMSAEAIAKGLDKDPEFQKRLALLNERALHGEVVDKEITAKITDEDIRALYDQQIAATPPANEVKARHILVKTKEEADAIVKQLDGGAKFEDIAKEKSTDPGSGAQGGDLGYFGQGQMVPEFEKAAFALEVGSYTKEPVQSQFGFHIILVEDKRAKQPPAFEQVKEQFRGALVREKYFALAKQLRAAAKVDITDPELKKSLDAVEQEQPQQPQQ
ncbi:peptidylprolyl isomerase [Arvimicrobium flavum]|uniref:peptidylprolyl isomerase n=1 Tax=Arvimicrobium flavum TaxID=3393320 RepID=UPI00237B3F4A|nr:peptidylprolyl isomerase [Mesorhizobium shangrilense]